MKSLLKKVTCTVLVLGMLAQCPQQLYAETITDAAGTITDAAETITDAAGTDVSGEPGVTDPGNGTENEITAPDDTQPDDTQQPQLPVPAAIKGIHTTKQGKTKVCIEWNSSQNAFSYVVYRKTRSGEYKKLAKTKEPVYIDKTAATGKKYTYRVLAVNEEQNAGKAAEVTFSNTKAVQIRSQKYTYSQMKTDMQELAKQYSDYCEMTKIGTSVQGRAIYDFAIGNPKAKESLLVVSTLHAREYICSAVLMKELEYYLENYNGTVGGVKPAKTLDKIQIHYIVMANPDGVTISQTKNSTWKANGRGVDLNRNFPAKPFIAGGKKGAQGYSGKKALR